jgi:hypothetical protein
MIKCEICGLEARVLPQTHLLKHGLTPSQYKERYNIESFFSPEARRERSEKYRGNGNPNFGNHPEGHIPWNKGIPDQKKGKTWEEFYGKDRSEQLKQKLSKKRTGMKVTFTEHQREMARECCKKMNSMDRSLIGPLISLSLKGKLLGEKNPNWRGGFNVYGQGFTDDLKEHIRDLYDRRCFCCGVEENGKKLDIHHIDNDKNNHETENLIPLCKSCHVKSHWEKVVILEPWFEKGKE